MDNPPFKRLSPELRNEIYERALRHKEEIEVTESAQTGTLITTNKKHATGFLRVCRLFRDEASSIFYFSNHFRFHDQAAPDFSTSGVSDVADTISKFVSKIGERNARYLQRVTAEVSISFRSTDDELAIFEVTWDQLRQLYQMRHRLRAESFVCDVRVSESFMEREVTHAFTLNLCDFETSRKAALEVLSLPVRGFESIQRTFLKLNCRYLLENCTEDGLREMAVDSAE